MKKIIRNALAGILILFGFQTISAHPPVPGAFPTGTPFAVPYFQDFDGSATLPEGWSGTMEVTGSHGISYTNGLAFNLYEEAGYTSCLAISPAILLSTNPCRLVFEYRIADFNNYPNNATLLGASDAVEIQLSTNNGLTYNTIYTIDQSNHVVTTNFAPVAVPLPGGGSNVMIRFSCSWGSGDYWVDIDDFSVEEVPGCTAPTALTATNITSGGFSAGWSGAAVADIEYGLQGYVQGTGTLISNVSINPWPVSGLTPMTTYDFYVRRNCGTGGVSSWSGPQPVTTTDQYKATLYPVSAPGGTGYVTNESKLKKGSWLNISTTQNDTSGRGFVKFDLGSIPSGALITRVTLNYFNFYREVPSAAINFVYPLSLDPVTATGTALYTDCGDGPELWSGMWGGSVPMWYQNPLNNDGLAYLSSQLSSGWAGFGIVRGSTSLYRFSGYEDLLFRPVLEVEYHIPVAPVFLMVPSYFDFQQVHAGFQSPPAIFTLSNIGVGTLVIDTVTLGGGDASQFFITDLNQYPKNLGAGESCQVQVTFSPTSTGSKQAFLQVFKDGEDPMAPLAGTGYLNPPGNLTATPLAGSQVGLDWEAPESPGGSRSALTYTVHRGVTPGIYTVSFPGITETSYTDVSTLPSTTYFYMVSAAYPEGSSNSQETSVTTFSGCPFPTAITLSAVSASSLSAGWNANGTTAWQIEWGPAGFVKGTGNVITTGVTNPYLLEGLEPGTAYDLYIRANCGSGLYSPWSGPATATTLCSVFPAPFMEEFEAAAFPPVCWSKTSGAQAWSRTTAASAYGNGSGSALAAFQNFSSPEPFHLMTFSFDLNGLYFPELQFDYAYATYSGETDSLIISYSNDEGVTYQVLERLAGGISGILNTGGIVTESFVPNVNEWGTLSIPLPAGTNKIRLTGISAWGNNLYVDNVEVYDAIQPLGISALVDPVSCFGDSDGIIDVTVTGGVPPYSFIWSDGSSSEDLTQVMAGIYTVTVTDAINLNTTGSWELTEPSEVSFIGRTTPVTCYGSSDGSISIIETIGGTPPYFYLWNTGATTPTISGLVAGSYSVSVSDANGCLVIGASQVISPDELTALPLIVQASCPGTADGSINLTVAGGIFPYSYQWSNGAITEDLSGLVAGTYTVTITDGNLCVKSYALEVGNLSQVCPTLTVTGQVTTVVCYGASQVIHVAGTPEIFQVLSGGYATFQAGQRIFFHPGSKVVSGGRMLARILPAGPWCPGLKITEEPAVAGEAIPVLPSAGSFMIYPNPAGGDITLIYRGEQLTSPVRAAIFGMNGERVLAEVQISHFPYQFRTSELPAGIYVIRIIAGAQAETIKLVRTK